MRVAAGSAHSWFELTAPSASSSYVDSGQQSWPPSTSGRIPCSQLLDVLGRGAEPFPSPPSQARSFPRSSLVKLGRAQGRSVAKGCWQVARRCRAQSWARRCRAATVSDVYRHKSASVATRQRRVQPGTATPCPKAFPSQARSFPRSSLVKLDVPGGSLDPLTEKQAKPRSATD